MANERNKILPYALSAIEGVNIQSQEDYSASSETTDGVSTGLANGNNFNKLAKQVSIMSSSLAEFIVNTLSEQTISDTNSIEEISSALNSAILKLIKDNEPSIPDKAGITVIDDNSADITSFNQITEDGIYYIYKQLSDGPSKNGEVIEYNFIHLIVINFSIAAQNFNVCMQMTSFGTLPYYPIPGNIGSIPMLRTYDKTSKQWEGWASNYGIPFINNNIVISDFTIDKLGTRFPIIATDNTFPNGNNTFMYSATKAQMRAQLGIADSPDLTNYFNKTTDKLNLATQVIGQLQSANIADNAITTSKIESLAITSDKLASSSVTNDKIANGAVTSEKIASKTITAGNIADNTITANQIAANAITSSELANNAVTNEKFSGILSVAKGGTNSKTGLNFINHCGLYPNVCSVLGIASTSRTIQEFYSAMPSVCEVSFLANNTNITDLPTNNYYYIHILKQDGNLSWITAKNWRDKREYIASVADNVVSEWLLVRNNNGSIPADLIPPTVLTYTNDQGTWTETKLSDGTTMLEGFGLKAINLTNNAFKINTPKSISINDIRNIFILMKQSQRNLGWVIPNYTSIDTSGFSVIIRYENASVSPLPYVEFTWSIKAILQN